MSMGMNDPAPFRALDALDAPPLVVPPKPPQTTVLGLAAGKPGAPHALVAVRYEHQLVSPGDPLFGEQPLFETHYSVLNAERPREPLSYPEVARRVNTIARRLYDRDSRGDYHVVVDATTVGQPVVALIRDSIIPQVCVTGAAVAPGNQADTSLLWSDEATVGRRYLTSRLQAILQGQRLRVAQGPLLDALLDTLRAYPADPSPDEPIADEDLVIALALACCSEHTPIGYGASLDTLPSALF